MSQVSIFASSVVAHGRALLGVPWRHRGRDAARGLDCIGFVLLSLLDAGWMPRNRAAIARLDYDRTSTGEELREVLESEGEAVPLGNKKQLGNVLRPSDVVTFTFPDHAYTQHIGLVSEIRNGVPYLIHCRASGLKSSSCVTEHALADGWLEALSGAYRLDGIQYEEAASPIVADPIATGLEGMING